MMGQGARGTPCTLEKTKSMPPTEGPVLSDYGYVHVAHIGRGQYANAQVVQKGGEKLVAKTVYL